MDNLLHPKHADMEIHPSQKTFCCKEQEEQLFPKIIHNTFKFSFFSHIISKQNL